MLWIWKLPFQLSWECFIHITNIALDKEQKCFVSTILDKVLDFKIDIESDYLSNIAIDNVSPL